MPHYAAYQPVDGWTANIATGKMSVPVLLDRGSPPPPFTTHQSVLYRSIEPDCLPKLDDRHEPFLLGKASPKAVPGVMEEIAEIIADLADQNPGSLESLLELAWFPKTREALRGFAAALGLEAEPINHLRSDALLPLNGSVQTHTDDGLGWYLSWVLYAEPIETPTTLAEDLNPELVAAGGLLGMTSLVLVPSGLFAFNANRFHGWIYNGRSIIAQVPLAVEQAK